MNAKFTFIFICIYVNCGYGDRWVRADRHVEDVRSSKYSKSGLFFFFYYVYGIEVL